MSLLCQPEGSAETETDEELVWLRNGVMVSLKDDNKIGRSSVCVTPVIYEDNEATFTCHLSNNATRRASITLNVTCEFFRHSTTPKIICIIYSLV